MPMNGAMAVERGTSGKPTWEEAKQVLDALEAMTR